MEVCLAGFEVHTVVTVKIRTPRYKAAGHNTAPSTFYSITATQQVSARTLETSGSISSNKGDTEHNISQHTPTS
jgi:hypothetical protein